MASERSDGWLTTSKGGRRSGCRTRGNRPREALPPATGRALSVFLAATAARATRLFLGVLARGVIGRLSQGLTSSVHRQIRCHRHLYLCAAPTLKLFERRRSSLRIRESRSLKADRRGLRAAVDPVGRVAPQRGTEFLRPASSTPLSRHVASPLGPSLRPGEAATCSSRSTPLCYEFAVVSWEAERPFCASAETNAELTNVRCLLSLALIC